MSHAFFMTKQKEHTADILIPLESAFTLVFWHQQGLVDDVRFHLNFMVKLVYFPLKNAHIDRFPLMKSQWYVLMKKVNFSLNRKLNMGFPTSYRWIAYVTSLSAKGGSKSEFVFLGIHFNFYRINSVIKFFLCENYSCSIAFLLSNGP